MRREPFQVERGLREHDVDALALDDVEHGVGEGGVGAGRNAMEGVAEVAADRPLAHVGPDQAHGSLAVCAQAFQERRGAGRAGGADEDGDGLQASHRSSSGRWSSSQAMFAANWSALPASHISRQPGRRSIPPQMRCAS